LVGQLGVYRPLASRVSILINSQDANEKILTSPLPRRERECASCKLGGQLRAVQANANLDSWHTSQDPPNPCLPGQAMLTPKVLTKLEHIEKVNFLMESQAQNKKKFQKYLQGQGDRTRSPHPSLPKTWKIPMNKFHQARRPALALNEPPVY